MLHILTVLAAQATNHIAASTAGPAISIPFEFKGIIAGEHIDPKSVGDCHGARSPGNPIYPPFVDGVDLETQCDLGLNEKIAGYDGTFSFTFAKRTDGKYTLSSAFITSNSDNWSGIAKAFISKYGAHYTLTIEPWESKAGTKLDNHVLIWKFKSGTLTLKEIGYRIDRMQAEYTDDFQAPAKPAKIDF